MRSAARSDRGSVSVFVAICAVGLLAVVGIVIDCGGRLRAIENADALAQEAARAAGQQLDTGAALSGGPPVVDPAAARSAAQQYLAANGVHGNAVVAADGRTIHVTVDGTYDTALLGVIGIGSMTVHGEGRASLVRGVRKAEQG
ncbi:hypothetical protein C7M71_004645 [Peterkaempfera bronchialis]|uniref:Uncharacterized protein n=1 Tax=Peterkaempfera bronchialis TaxID=2126346 RepID=A0A345T5B2_9ACTN|nr:hypothetical protein C7M71_004645 [Peterkaempfera bronchialis]